MVNNTKLVKAFEKAYSLGTAVPNGVEKETLVKLTKKYAESMKINCTPSEIDKTVINGLNEMSNTTVNNCYDCRI